jgi:methionyl-tRNA synthetase
MDENHLYLTTPIYYVNGDPHLGHSHTTTMGDIFKRALGMGGLSVFYTTGVDEHGQKNAQEIAASGLSADEYLDRQCQRFTHLFESLHISHDYFVRTSHERHKAGVRSVLSQLYEGGLIFKKAYSGLYCQGCEQFKTESDLDESGYCPDHHTKPDMEEESNYFFSLEPHRVWLTDYIHSHEEWISPSVYRNKVLDMLSEPLPDLCVSRPKSRVGLGVELPFDPDYVAYVWFDALINYITSIGFPEMGDRFTQLWKNSCHLMAKDIIKTHCIYWPIMLRAIGLPPVGKNIIHGFWVGEDGRKMSKTLKNGVDPQDLISRYGADSLRAFLAARMGRHESRMGETLFNEYYNGFLANTLGNVYLRSVKLIEKYTASLVPECDIYREDQAFLDSMVLLACEGAVDKVDFDQISRLMKKLEEMGKEINRFVNEKQPWILAKNTEDRKALESVLIVCLEGVRLLFESAWPVMPETSENVLSFLNLPSPEQGRKHTFFPRRFRGGHKIQIGKVLFPRV